jgi:4-amino-4-deoxy-L-arabinose transferase-like glycosyltransferase
VIASQLAALYRRVARYEFLLVILACLLLFVPGLWSYGLIDPWETHYGEVGRRMLDDQDWVVLRWQNEVFQSKPVLTFWLIAAGMKATGVASLGGYSGELTVSPLAVFALRIPFVLFAIGGLVSVWWMLSRLVSRRIAWLSLLVTATTPFYLMVARQAITDMPMVACLMGAIACFAMAVEAGDEPLRPLWKKLDAYHVFLALLALFVGGQLVYYGVYFHRSPQLAPGLRVIAPQLVITLPFWVGLVGFGLWSWQLQPTRGQRAPSTCTGSMRSPASACSPRGRPRSAWPVRSASFTSCSPGSGDFCRSSSRYRAAC